MGAIFLNLVNRSINAGWLILAVLALRHFLKKAPGWTSCLLWGLVALKLICPFSPESMFSLILNPESIPVEAIYSDDPAIRDNPYYHRVESRVPIIDDAVNPIVTDISGPALRGNILIFAGIWLGGASAVLVYGGIGLWRLKKKVGASIFLHDNLYLCDDIASPFILGIVKPRIYLPSDAAFGGREETVEYVVAHERAHLRRHDHWWKAFGYLLLAAYWFCPLVWLGFGCFCRDMELACDERVVRNMGKEEKSAYAQALLDCSFPHRVINGGPLAFGEIGVKKRVQAVLNYSMPSGWITAAALVACGIAALCFLTDPKADEMLRDPDARTWLNYYGMAMEYTMVQEMEMKDFPGVTIRWSPMGVEAVEDGETILLYSGYPVWSVAFTDLNDDGKQEICSTVSFGFGMIDDRIMVYDYAAGKCYELSDRGTYDYVLRVAGGRTEALRRRYGAENSMWEIGSISLTRRGIRFSATGERQASGEYRTY